MQPRETRQCKKHGETIHVLEKNGQFRCRKCRSYYVAQNRIKTKQKLVDLLGGKCQICGYNKSIWALEFHHINPEEKDFSFSQDGITRGWDKCLTEVQKCALLCCRCHREVEHGVTNLIPIEAS